MNNSGRDFKVDLDQLLHDFNAFEQSLASNSLAQHHLADENKQLKVLLEKERKQIKRLQNDFAQSRDIESNLRAALDKRCDSDDANRVLKQEICKLEEQLKSLKAEFIYEAAKYDKEKVEMDEQYKLKEIQLRKEFSDQAEREMSEWRRVSDAQEQTIGQLKRRVTAVEKDKESEVTRLQLEYDEKLKSIQKQNAETNSSTVKHDRELYRKKVQQLRSESQKEISDLKSLVSNLQHELAFYQQPSKPVAGRSARFTNRR